VTLPSWVETGRRLARTRSGTLVLSIAAGLVAALAHPPFGFWPGLLGFGVLLWLLDSADAARPLRSAFWRGWLAGSAYFLVSTWWVGEAFLVDVAAHGWQAPFAVGFLAGGLALLWGAAGTVYRWLAPRGWERALVFAAVFGLFEWLRGHILTGFPWDLPGEAWRAGGWISQSASVVGAYGLSVVTMAMFAAAGLWIGPDSRRTKAIASGIAAAVFVALGLFGAVRLAAPSPAPAGPRIRVVQPNIDQAVKWTPESFRAIFENYMALTAQAPAAGQRTPDVVIWPESAIPANSADYLAEGSWTHAELMAALHPGQILLMGAVRTEGVRYYNSLLAIRRDPGGLTRLGVYNKHHLVPFGEYMPADALMGAIGFKALVNVGDGFTEGPAPAPMTMPGLPPLQALICYESLFPAFVADDHPRPAWIANVSNDAWFGKTSGPWQHLNLASYRAIEEGLPMVRATPTGVSAVIDARGRTLDLLGQGARGVIDANLPGAAPPPLYRQLRDWPFWLMTLGGLALALWRKRIASKS
jgi:apolipoprotein N-acyltransferase